jgi:multicomponent Na+:H+ antiporter subunit G
MLINILIVILFAIASTFTQSPVITAIINVVTAICLISGIFFFFATAVGVIRFPDFFTRLHAAGKADTLSTILILFSCALYALNSSPHIDKTTILSAIKILLIISFIFIGSPTATHALINAGYESEIEKDENDPTD